MQLIVIGMNVTGR